MATCLAHGALHTRTIASIAWWAWISLLVFAGTGYLLGTIAARTVEDSVRATIADQLEAEGATADGQPSRPQG